MVCIRPKIFFSWKLEFFRSVNHADGCNVVPCTPLKLLYFGIRIDFGVQIFALSRKLLI